MSNLPAGDDNFDEFINEVVASDREVEQRKPSRKVSSDSITLVTASEFVKPGIRIVETLPMISARCAFGLGVVKDLSIAARDTVGGRVKTLEIAIEKAELEVIKELKRQAIQFGAHAVTQVRFQTTDLVGKGVCVVAHGTPVKLEAENISQPV